MAKARKTTGREDGRPPRKSGIDKIGGGVGKASRATREAKVRVQQMRQAPQPYSAEWYAKTNFGEYLDENLEPLRDERGNVRYESEVLSKLPADLRKFAGTLFRWTLEDIKTERAGGVAPERWPEI